MAEETRTSRAVVDLGFTGVTTFEAGVAKIDAGAARAVQALEKLLVRSAQVSETFGVVKTEADRSIRSFDAYAESANNMFGVNRISAYIEKVQQLSMAWRAGEVSTSSYVQAVEHVGKILPQSMQAFRIATQDLGKFQDAMMKARQEARLEGIQLGLSSDQLEQHTQTRAKNILVRQQETTLLRRKGHA